MEQRVLTIYDLEQLNDAAEYIISSAQFAFPNYNEDGEFIAAALTGEERRAVMETWLDQAKNHYLCFRENEELHNISFWDAFDMSLSEVKEKYLKEHMTKLRNILRKGTMEFGGVVSDSVPDDYLDDVLALRWKEHLKLCAIQWEKEK